MLAPRLIQSLASCRSGKNLMNSQSRRWSNRLSSGHKKSTAGWPSRETREISTRGRLFQRHSVKPLSHLCSRRITGRALSVNLSVLTPCLNGWLFQIVLQHRKETNCGLCSSITITQKVIGQSISSKSNSSTSLYTQNFSHWKNFRSLLRSWKPART